MHNNRMELNSHCLRNHSLVGGIYILAMAYGRVSFLSHLDERACCLTDSASVMLSETERQIQ